MALFLKIGIFLEILLLLRNYPHKSMRSFNDLIVENLLAASCDLEREDVRPPDMSTVNTLARRNPMHVNIRSTTM